MNLSKLITRIKREIGIYQIALPIENIDQFIADVIRDVTLETFSTLSPSRDTFTLDLRDAHNRLHRCEEYMEFLVSGRNNKPISFIEQVEPDYSGGNGWGSFGPTYRGEWRYQNILGNVAQQMSNLTAPAITFDWLPPNRLRIYNVQYIGKVLVTYGMKHDPSLASIPETAAESFYKLAVLDVKQTLYNVVKHYDDLQTAHGHISLHIEDWQEAASKREDLVNQWEDTYHLDGQTVYWA